MDKGFCDCDFKILMEPAMKDLFKKNKDAGQGADTKKTAKKPLLGKKDTNKDTGKAPKAKGGSLFAGVNFGKKNNSVAEVDSIQEEQNLDVVAPSKKAFGKKPSKAKKTKGDTANLDLKNLDINKLDTQKLIKILAGVLVVLILLLLAKLFLFNDNSEPAPVPPPAPEVVEQAPPAEPVPATDGQVVTEPAPAETVPEQPIQPVPEQVQVPAEPPAPAPVEVAAPTPPVQPEPTPVQVEPAPPAQAPVQTPAPAKSGGKMSYDEFLKETENRVYRERSTAPPTASN